MIEALGYAGDHLFAQEVAREILLGAATVGDVANDCDDLVAAAGGEACLEMPLALRVWQGVTEILHLPRFQRALDRLQGLFPRLRQQRQVGQRAADDAVCRQNGRFLRCMEVEESPVAGDAEHHVRQRRQKGFEAQRGARRVCMEHAAWTVATLQH